jgi:hypothetical protein
VEQRRQLHCGKLTAAIPAGYTAVVKPSKMSAIQTQVVTEALMLFACEWPLCATSGRSFLGKSIKSPAAATKRLDLSHGLNGGAKTDQARMPDGPESARYRDKRVCALRSLA